MPSRNRIVPKSQMIMQNSRLPIWVIYDRPDDYPNHYVVRKFYGNMPTDEIYGATGPRRIAHDADEGRIGPVSA